MVYNNEFDGVETRDYFCRTQYESLKRESLLSLFYVDEQ